MKSFEVTRGQCDELHGREPGGASVGVCFDLVDGEVVKRRRTARGIVM